MEAERQDLAQDSINRAAKTEAITTPNREAVVIDNLQLRAASIYIEARSSLGSI